MSKVYASVACNLDADLLAASFLLLEEERVEAIEWSFDTLYKQKEIPAWFLELLKAYSNEQRLIGHGVFFSLFSGRWTQDQQQWLERLKGLSNEFQFDHITEHFGFMTGKDFHQGAPLNIPYSKTTLAIGRDRLARIYDACQCPVGLENLAFSYAADEVKRHGAFLEELIEPVNGFIILDLHNMYCQSHNFSILPGALLSLHPLKRVREIHISGGSWEGTMVNPGRKIRRDTHDGAVPEAVFEFLALAMPRCPNLKYVVLEQMGTALKTAEARKQFYTDFIRMQQITDLHNRTNERTAINSFLLLQPLLLNDPVIDEVLYAQQKELSGILETALSYEEAWHQLLHSSLARSDWNIESWDPGMIETAMRIAQKWKDG